MNTVRRIQLCILAEKMKDRKELCDRLGIKDESDFINNNEKEMKGGQCNAHPVYRI